MLSKKHQLSINANYCEILEKEKKPFNLDNDNALYYFLVDNGDKGGGILF